MSNHAVEAKKSTRWPASSLPAASLPAASLPAASLPAASLLAAALALAGCTRFHTTSHAGHETPAETLPVAARSATDLDLAKLPGPYLAPPPPFAGSYRVLTEHNCQCLAARASRTAAVLEAEAELVGPRHGPGRRAGLQQSILETAALEARNKDAGTALELYFRLAEAESKRDLLNGSLREIGAAVLGGERLKKQGLKVPAEFDEFQKQQLDLQTDSARLDAGIEKLNRNLVKMLDLKLDVARERLWPAADFQVSGSPVAADQAVNLGLGHRPELVLLRQVREDTSPANLAAARKILAANNMLLGMGGSGPLAKLKSVICADETGVRREQLDELLAQREADISGEIRDAVLDLNTEIQLVALAKSRLLNAQAKLREQEDKRAKGTLSSVDVVSTRLAWLKARGDLVHEVMAWHIARAKLKQAQGLLVTECGYDHHHADAPVAPGNEPVVSQARPVMQRMAPNEILVNVSSGAP